MGFGLCGGFVVGCEEICVQIMSGTICLPELIFDPELELLACRAYVVRGLGLFSRFVGWDVRLLDGLEMLEQYLATGIGLLRCVFD